MRIWIPIGLVAAGAVALLLNKVMMQDTHAAIKPNSQVSIFSDGRVDHKMFDTLLKRYVDQKGFVDYKQWKQKDVSALDAYLGAISLVDPAQLRDRSEVLTFWINIYNALTIKGILHFYPTKSIKDHVGLTYNLWKDYKMEIHGKDYSLDEIEHKILRKMDEPRIHFAIVCASISCPRLLNEAYTSEKLDEQLNLNTRDFFAHPGKFNINREKRQVMLSPILDWFKKDFGKDQAARLAFIKPFLSNEKDQAFLEEEKLKVKHLDYDWNLNEQ